MNLKVVVVGAGIGGLTTAATLARNGVNVDVLERRNELPNHGTTLGMWPEAVRALDRTGCGDQLRRIAFPQTQGWIRRSDGAPLVRCHQGEASQVRSLSPPAGRRQQNRPASPAQWRGPTPRQ
jgi:2-polyprenyl-6-methoxyphenol hydroxylase-like FAD-dependent oxidoreductase